MSSRTLTIDTLIQSDLWREFEKTARDKRRRPVELLADVIADFLETQEGVTIFDDIERDIRHTNYTEDDAVELVKTYRASRRQS
ncbi:MAG: hypothetical protein AABO57_05940 [Acidobacteriota bacterium]